MANTKLAPVLETAPRFIRAMHAPAYLGMCREEFKNTVRPHIREFPIGKQGVAFDRHELDQWADAYIEAMAMGLPIVGTQVGGVPEVVGDGDNGLLVPVDDSPALAEAIIRLLNDPAMRAAMAARSRDRVASHFLTDTMCEHMLLLYRRLLAGRSR